MKHHSKKIIYNVIAVIILVAGITYVATKFIHLGDVEYTDNAQVKQLIVPVNSRVQGFVKEVRFNEYQPVKKGDTLVIIEDMEYRHRVAQAEADYQGAMAGRQVAASTEHTAQNNITAADAGLIEVKALLENAEREDLRYKNLLDAESATRQEYDGVHTRYISLLARYKALQQQNRSTVLVKDEQHIRLAQNDAGIQLAKAALELAKLNLSYTVIIAPTDGFTGRKNLQAGQFIQPGQTMVEVVDKNEKWVIANYKETQSRNIKDGQTVDLVIDAFPKTVFKGVVKSMAMATGASFSIMPQDNSAGNFVKIEQRIPVRIEFANQQDAQLVQQLRAGMNVECTVKY